MDTPLGSTLSMRKVRESAEIEYKNRIPPLQSPKESDYEGMTLSILTCAIARFDVKILTECAFPDHKQAMVWARSTWEGSCKEVER